jgi:hypothetical protein
MTLPRFLLTTAAVLSIATVSAEATPTVTVLSSGILSDLNGVKVGQVSLERQSGRVYLHVTGAGRAAGANLELLVSGLNLALKAGDHSGPGTGALRAGPFEQAEVRYALPERSGRAPCTPSGCGAPQFACPRPGRG